MEIKVVLNTLGQLAVLLGALMLIPGLVAAIYKEPLSTVAFAFASFAAIVIGIMMKHFGTKDGMGHKEAFVIVSLGWLFAAILGALPYIFLGLSPADAVFESISGFTTAGATILTEDNSQGYWVFKPGLSSRQLGLCLC